ncbi:MAG: isoprenylcysteine carboxylmethyltransferase family protein [Chloroflexota bacterium]|nr:isoprenylcysteine carboxylmethyltransferase family protein [Chloroflexota bacterium]
MSTRIPALGPRGEGWVTAQFMLFLLIGGVGVMELGRAPWSTPVGLAAAAGGLAFIVLGLAFAIRAMVDLREGLTPFPRPVEGAPLVVSSAYRRVRHPIYCGVLLAALGWALLTTSLLVLGLTALLTVLLDLKSRREEAWLLQAYPEYEAYRARTRRFIPGIY